MSEREREREFVCVCACARTLEYVTFVYIDEGVDVSVYDCWGCGGCYFILFVQLYEFLILLCSLYVF